MIDVLIVDDDPEIVALTREYLEDEGYRVTTRSESPGALELLRDRAFDALVTDLTMPDIDGIDLVEQARAMYPDLVAVVMTGFATIDSAVEAMRRGASDYLPKPFSLVQLKIALERSLEHRRILEENERLRTELKERYRFENIVGNSESMQTVFTLMNKVSQVDSTVLVQGDSGVGKELIVRALHYRHELRKDGPLVAVHCGAIPSELIESELFGHVKGAFTGADRDRPGKFELAHGGTIFLDEIGTMRPDMQVKLLRVLQERRVTRVGGSDHIPIDVRVMAASNVELRQLVAEGSFRRDLFYRLNVIPIAIPPLRARRSDIPMLARHFVDRDCQHNRLPAKELSQEAMKVLMLYDWPGNVRELENAMEYATVISGARTRILREDLPLELLSQPAGSPLVPAVTEDGVDLRDTLSKIEKDLIRQSLDLAKGNKARAAALLNIKRTTFVEKLKRVRDTETLQ